MSHSSSWASLPSPAHSSLSKKYLAKSTGSGVGCSPCGDWVGSGSRILNQVAFRCSLATFSLTRFCLLPFQTQALTCCLSWCQLSFINKPHDTGSDKTVGRSIMSTRHLPAENKNMLLHPLLHITMIYTAVTVSLIIAFYMFLQYFCPTSTIFDSDIANLKLISLFKPTDTYIHFMHLHLRIHSCIWQLTLNYKVHQVDSRWAKIHQFPLAPYVTGPPLLKTEGKKCSQCKQLSVDYDGFRPQCKAN